MADITIYPDLADTQQTTEQILTHTMQGKRVRMLVPHGRSRQVVQRIRTKLTRVRAKLRLAGKVPQQFRLNQTTHPETHAGVRFDCIIFWIERNDRHDIALLFESMEIKRVQD